MNPKLKLRKAIESDFETTFLIKNNSLKLYVDKIWGWDELLQRKVHKEYFSKASTKLIIFDGKEIGYIAMQESDNEIYIENILIDNGFQNLGIGTKIMKSIIKRANSRRKTIRLQVFKINVKAQKFYRNLGFDEISEKEYHIEMKKTSSNNT